MDAFGKLQTLAHWLPAFFYDAAICWLLALAAGMLACGLAAAWRALMHVKHAARLRLQRISLPRHQNG